MQTQVTKNSRPGTPLPDHGPLADAVAFARQHGGRVTPELLASVASDPVMDRMLRIVRSAQIGVSSDQLDRVNGELLTGPTNCPPSCTHPDATDVEHDLVDGQWWHLIEVGTISTRVNDLAESDERDVSLSVALMHFGDRPPRAWVSNTGFGEGAAMDLSDVREAIAVLTVAERLLAADADGEPR